MTPKEGGPLWRAHEGRCHYCNILLTQAEASRDHVVPRSKGGKGTKTNLVLSCEVCNHQKGSIPVDEFLETYWLSLRRKRVAKLEAHEEKVEMLRRQGLR